ncbi:MAG: PAS domain S-box protein [Deltaproteobacteria bacterium]|nr:PAS domain S-box protein [Deltaproteobacteria bacterium]
MTPKTDIIKASSYSDGLLHLGKRLRHSLIFKLILMVGTTLLLSISTWAYFNIRYQKEQFVGNMIENADRLSNTIRLGTHYAMMLNSRDDINQIIQNVSRQKNLNTIRIINKEREIKYSNNTSEIDEKIDMKFEGCRSCHSSDPPVTTLSLKERTRLIWHPDRHTELEIISPIYNEPGCSSGACHFHPADKKVLGIMSVVFSMKETEATVRLFGKWVIALAAFCFLVTAMVIFLFAVKFVNLPISKLIKGTQRIAKGQYLTRVDIKQKDEMGQLSEAINQMGESIHAKQTELNRQRNEYQSLFEHVPCLIAVQDKDYRLIGFNLEFSKKFNPKLGDYCYRAYKGRTQKCDICPVEKTFADGRIHIAQETGRRKDGSVRHWIVKTSPIKDVNGDIVAAMEMSVDITHSRQLEEKLEETEKKYQEIFNNMPNPAFVLDENTLRILDCNQRTKTVYGYARDEILDTSFLDLFKTVEKEAYENALKCEPVLNRVSQLTKGGGTIYVDIWVSPLQYMEKEILLVTTSDITQRLETEQQLIQASKMATLGEMATGVAHELNQPLSVIKTASSFCMKKVRKNEDIEIQTVRTIIEKIDSNVDRADKIISHMRQLARKTDLVLVKIQMNDVLRNAFEIFSQQLRIRGIDVIWDITEDLPLVRSDPDRMEQVFINLMINARDAIEDNWVKKDRASIDKRITLRTWSEKRAVCIEVRDSGSGIPKNIVEKIYEPFFTTKEVGKGTGLGLSISYGFVKDCGGSIEVQSTSSKGTSFVLKFPVEEANEEI